LSVVDAEHFANGARRARHDWCTRCECFEGSQTERLEWSGCEHKVGAREQAGERSSIMHEADEGDGIAMGLALERCASRAVTGD
jgi:hypothetical protein